MIRLIATDLDGTLLDSSKKIPEELPELVSKLAEKDIVFVPVSGRSYARLRKQFAPESVRMSFVCCNGGLVMHQDQMIYYTAFEKEELSGIMKVIREIPGIIPCICCLDTVYYEPAAEQYKDFMLEFFGHITPVDRVEDVIGEYPVIKISSIDTGGVQENSFPILKKAGFMEKYTVVDSGDNWLDVSPKTSHKGVGILELCKKLDIDMNEVMIFGDYINDLPMMTLTDNSWCMKNGHEDVKKVSGHITEWTNDENGVIRTIEKEVLK